jgi:hypothetical protein
VALAVVGFVFVDFTPSGWAHEHKVHIFPSFLCGWPADGSWREMVNGEERRRRRID